MKVHRRKRLSVPVGPSHDLRQSWPGNVSLTFALVVLALLLAEGFLRLQAASGTLEVYRLLKPWLIRGEALAILAGLLVSLMSFPFSERNHRNAIIGLWMHCTFAGAWVALHAPALR